MDRSYLGCLVLNSPNFALIPNRLECWVASDRSQQGKKIQLSAQALDYIEQLRGLGIYGTKEAEVISTLVNDQLKALLKDGTIKAAPERSTDPKP